VFPGLGTGDGFPPTRVVVCERDGLRPSGEAFVRTLRDAGVDVTWHLEPGADRAADDRGDRGLCAALSHVGRALTPRP